MKTALFLLIIAAAFLGSALRMFPEDVERKELLSDYGFFQGDLAKLEPSADVFFYDVNTALFSNYAEKSRFIRLPKGSKISFRDSTPFEFPVGTILIKNFYYPKDFRNASLGRTIIETRLLVRKEKGWDAWPYIWNDEQTEALYDPSGEVRSVSYLDLKGKKRTTNYAIPNKNQCKGCHVSGKAMMPIGLTARQLDRHITFGEGSVGQLHHWLKSGILEGVNDLAKIKRLAVWDDPASGTLDVRARAYLDANCGHCHSAGGPASTSGLFLDIFETRPVHLGVNKAPVAAGRGAGNLTYDIVPGHPEQSILLFRMKTTDPAIAMPEIGREQIHAEGVELIEQWIRSNQF